MTRMMILMAVVIATASLVGCKRLVGGNKKKEGGEAPAPATVQEKPTGEGARIEPEKKEPEAAVVKEEPKVEEEKKEETLVSREDIEKAVKIYKLLHREDLKDEEKKKKFVSYLEENNWTLESYTQVIFDIGRDPASTKIYKELQEKE